MSRILQNTSDVHILLIDGNNTFVNIFAKLLRIKGFFVDTETSFQTGLLHLKNKTYHVVFVDTPLDGFTSRQILNLFYENKIFQKTTVFLFSSIDVDASELDEWKKYGLYMYLKKPVKRDIIIKALNDVCGKINFSTSQIKSEYTLKDDLNTVEQSNLHKTINDQKQSMSEETQHAAPESILDSELVKDDDIEEEPTQEQLEKVDRLQKQIQELEDVQKTINDQKQSMSEETQHAAPESVLTSARFINDSSLRNIVDDLKKSLNHKFEQPSQYSAKPSVEFIDQDKEIIKTEIQNTRLEISKLRNQIKLFDNISNGESQNFQKISNKKKHKMNKKRIGVSTTKKNKVR